MSIQATATVGQSYASVESDASKSGFWKRFFDGLILAREREARLRVSQYMRGMSDEQLKGIGYSASEVVMLRTSGHLPKVS